jgi:hypothetical protein
MSTFLRAAWRRLTRRAAPPSTPAPIALRPLEPGLAERLAAFWRAFEILRPRLEAELPRTLSPALQQALSAQVDALQSELAWELGRAPDGVFELALSGEGRFPLRRLTEAWRQAAPAGLTRWRFLPARGATPGHTQLDYAGHSVDLGQLAFGLTPDEARARVDVTVWHPGFAAMEPGARSAVAFLALDGLLGEDEVERWVGRVATELTRGEGFVNAQALHAHVTALAAAPHDTFAHLQGKNAKGHAALATLNLALKRLNHLAYEDQLVVTLGYRAADAQGLPHARGAPGGAGAGGPTHRAALGARAALRPRGERRPARGALLRRGQAGGGRAARGVARARPGLAGAARLAARPRVEGAAQVVSGRHAAQRPSVAGR